MRYLHVLFRKSRKWPQVQVLPRSQPRVFGCILTFSAQPDPSIPAYSRLILAPVKQRELVFICLIYRYSDLPFLILGWFLSVLVFMDFIFIIYLNGTICGIPQGVK